MAALGDARTSSRQGNQPLNLQHANLSPLLKFRSANKSLLTDSFQEFSFLDETLQKFV